MGDCGRVDSLLVDVSLLGERGEATGRDMALLAVSDRDPGGDELIWTGATAPFTGERGGTCCLKGGDVAGTSMYVGEVAVLGRGSPKTGGDRLSV